MKLEKTNCKNLAHFQGFCLCSLRNKTRWIILFLPDFFHCSIFYFPFHALPGWNAIPGRSAPLRRKYIAVTGFFDAARHDCSFQAARGTSL